MDGIHNVAGGRSNKITIAGKEYTLTPMTLDQYAERERYILSLKPHPLSVIESAPAPPPPPQVPVPPDANCTPQERSAYGLALQRHASERQQYESAMQVRQQFMAMLRDECLKPRVVSLSEDAAFDQSLHGIGYRLWRSLRGHHPEINSVQAALLLLEKAGSSRLQEVRSKLDESEEKDILGNSEALAAGAPAAVAFPGV